MLTPPTGRGPHLALLLVLGTAPCWAQVEPPRTSDSPPGEFIPPDAELESTGAVIGEIVAGRREAG